MREIESLLSTYLHCPKTLCGVLFGMIRLLLLIILRLVTLFLSRVSCAVFWRLFNKKNQPEENKNKLETTFVKEGAWCREFVKIF